MIIKYHITSKGNKCMILQCLSERRRTVLYASRYLKTTGAIDLYLGEKMRGGVQFGKEIAQASSAPVG